MGTRHMIGVIHEGKYKIAQYGQWDGYPDGQGSVVLEFLSNMDMETMKHKLKNCKFVDRAAIRQLYVAAGDSPDNTSGFVSMEIADRFSKMWPSLSRDTGADILNIVYESANEVPLTDNSDFLNDDVFCEFAYVVDLDKQSLRFYMNGNNLVAEYLLSDLPTVEEMNQDVTQFYQRVNKEIYE